MSRAVYMFLAGWIAWGGCAGDRKITGLVASSNSTDVVLYKLEFSAINVEQDGSGDTRVEVKLKSGKALVINGDASNAKVSLKYMVRNADGDPYFEHFTTGGEQELTNGATTFMVNLNAGEAHQLRVETVIDNSRVWGQSGIIKVLGDEEDLEDDDEDL